MKHVSSVVIGVVLLAGAAARADQPQQKDLLLHSPFEGSSSAAYAKGNRECELKKEMAFKKGVDGQAIVLGEGAFLQYQREGNFSAAGGTLMMWIKPDWASSSMSTSDNRTLFNMGRVAHIYYAGYTKGYNALCRKQDGNDFVITSTKNTGFQKGAKKAKKA